MAHCPTGVPIRTAKSTKGAKNLGKQVHLVHMVFFSPFERKKRLDDFHPVHQNPLFPLCKLYLKLE